MGLFGKSKKEREKEYMSKLDVPSCLKENFELIIDDAFTIMGVGTVATGNILIGMCREGENACIYKANGDILESRITTVDVHTKERKANGCGYKTEHVGLGLRGISKEQLLVIHIPFQKKTNVEWCYLLGNFGVQVSGRMKKLIKMPGELHYGNFVNQGFPFYAGNMEYEVSVYSKEGRLCLETSHYRGALITVDRSM